MGTGDDGVGVFNDFGDEATRFTPDAPDNEGFTNVLEQTWHSQMTPFASRASRSDGVSFVQWIHVGI